ncbi:MAG: AI-2E family transporter [Candidatus Moranbacteria bacterium]|nr:AI-2E family transporter [Candidatus Moranbacteria bacterium]
MELRAFNVYFFFFLFFAVGTVVFFIFQPFLTAIIAAAILTALFKGPYHYFERFTRGHRGWSAFLTCLLVILIIVTPIFFVLSLAISEANTLYHALGEESSLERVVGQVVGALQSLPYLNIFFDTETFHQERILEDIKNFGQNALGLIQAAYQGVTHFVFWVFVMFFTLFYFLIDGKKTLRFLMQLSPLRNEHDALLIKKFISISRAALKGTIVVGMVQGFLGGIAFWIAGIPSPAIWGLVMVLFSIIPMVGSAIVWVPAGIIMLLLGYVWQGVFVLVVGAGVISVIDNILRPKLVGKDTQMHPLMIFFATLGGISLFGLPGFVIGPIIVSLFMALGEIYSIEFKEQLKEYNQ